MRGVTRFHNPDVNVTINISLPAQRLLGAERVPRFVTCLTDFLRIVGAHIAWVSKRSLYLEISFVSPQFGKSHVRVEP